MTALIVDDEPLARLYLRRLLVEQSVTVLGEAEDVATALEKAETLQPDLVFLDIQMPGLTGMHMARALSQLDVPPLVVFVTGYSEHAVAAFENDAIDYLLKPVPPERLALTLARARSRLSARRKPEHPPSAATEHPDTAPEKTGLLRRVPIREDYAVRLLRLTDIVWAESRDRRVWVRTSAGGEHRTYYTLTQLEQMLPADQFVRVHDSYLAALDSIEELIFLGNHAYEIRMAGGQRLPVGRTRYAELRRRLGIQLPGSDGEGS